MPPDSVELWRFLPLGYALSVALEIQILLLGLSPRHSRGRKVMAGFWLTACTYPIVVIVLPELIWRPLGPTGYWLYVAVAEIFAPAAECGLFWLAFWTRESIAASRRDFTRDMLAIVAANLASFLIGGWLVRWLEALI